MNTLDNPQLLNYLNKGKPLSENTEIKYLVQEINNKVLCLDLDNFNYPFSKGKAVKAFQKPSLGDSVLPGDAVNPSFPVDIDKNMIVGHLKYLIKQKKDPIIITLLQTNLNVVLLPNATMKIVFLDEPENSNIGIIAKPPVTAKIRRATYSSEESSCRKKEKRIYPEESEESRDGLMLIHLKAKMDH
ncbi:26534_t:CDS:2 [Gigaspora margarita]|uniref:26534_t:CDS:1 n=1 Tax=Gigaspora margarita TaxID=4874 RepID=A0ABN7V471_GIGMA|nr:26534_t:CDS:2 [Gigaspora margarita]